MSEHLAPHTPADGPPAARAPSLADLVTARLDGSRLGAGPRALIREA